MAGRLTHDAPVQNILGVFASATRAAGAASRRAEHLDRVGIGVVPA